MPYSFDDTPASTLSAEVVQPQDERFRAQKFRRAVHEVGHAIIAYGIGLPFVKIVVTEKDGFVDTRPTAPLLTTDLHPSQQAYQDFLLLYGAGGAAAEKLIFGDEPQGAKRDREEHDTEIEEFEAKVGLAAKSLLFNASWDMAVFHAMGMLGSWHYEMEALEKLAHTLVEQGEMTALEFQAALADVVHDFQETKMEALLDRTSRKS